MAKAKKKPGRKPKQLTPEIEESFLKAVRLGAPIKDACGCAGISETLYYGWMQEAEEGKTARAKRFAEFRDNIKKVEGEATTRWLALVEKAALAGTWQAAAWKLERRRGMTLKVQQEISGPEGEPIKHEITDAKERLLDKLAQLASREKPE